MTKEMIKLGWEEWLALPDLHLPAIKAKIDTGARTSALYASHIVPFVEDGTEMLRFTLYPDPKDLEIAVDATAPVLDRREVTSSNGSKELRYVIETRLQVGGRSWLIEVTLTDRRAMAYPMLLGRMALAEHCVVIPGESRQQPELSLDLYERRALGPGSLTIGVLSDAPEARSLQKMSQEATRRGHTLRVLNPAELTLRTGPTPAVLQSNAPVRIPDAMMLRAKPNRINAAVLRQFMVLGSYCPNHPDGIMDAAHGVTCAQKLNMAHIQTPQTQTYPPEARDDDIEMLLIGKSLIVQSRDGNGQIKLTSEERRFVRRAARVFQCEVLGVSLRRTAGDAQIVGLSPRPALYRKPRHITRVFDLIEMKVRPRRYDS